MKKNIILRKNQIWSTIYLAKVIYFKIVNIWNLLVIQWLDFVLSLASPWVQALVWEKRSHKPRGMTAPPPSHNIYFHVETFVDTL